MTPRALSPGAAALAALTGLTALTVLTTLAHAQDQCDSVQIGNETSVAYSLAERRVEPDMFKLEIEPDVCGSSAAVGLKVTACDREAPRVLLLDTARGVVARGGVARAGPSPAPEHPAATTAAYVYVTVFCADDGDDESLTSLPSTTVDLESRFSSLDKPLLPSRLTSMLNMMKEHTTPSLGPLGTPSSLAKRLKAIKPKQQSGLPAWLGRPPSPSSSKRLSLPDGKTQKSVERSSYRSAKPSNEEELYLQWSEEKMEPDAWETAPRAQYPQQSKTRKIPPEHREHPPSSTKHIPNKPTITVPVEEPALSEESHPAAPHSSPKLLVLLHDDPPCSHAHSLEDDESHPENRDENIPWPDYPPDYSADDADIPDTGNREQFQHQPLPSESHELFDSYNRYGSTDRPMPPKVHHLVSWVKSAYPAVLKRHMHLKPDTAEPPPGDSLDKSWTFLSQLLLSHPSFRDSTQVVRIR